jgi:outer membrane protein
MPFQVLPLRVKMCNALVCFLLFVSGFTALSGQTTWSLKACLEHAEKNSIPVRQIQLQVMQSRAGLTQSWAALAPTLSINSSHSTNFGLRFDPTSGVLQDDKFQSFSSGVNSNFVVFNGLSNYKAIAQSRASYKGDIESLEQALDDLYLNVTDLFMQVMFAEERLGIAEKQVELIEAEENRTRILFEAGALVKGDYLTIKAQAANQEVQRVAAENAVRFAKLALAQALMLPDGDITIEHPSLDNIPITSWSSLPGVEVIYQKALGERPVIRAAEWRVQASQFGLGAARGSYYPSIGLNMGISTIFSELRKSNPFDPNSPPIPFWDQMRQNRGQQFSFALNVPIFNGLSTRTSVQQARIAVENAELALLEQRQRLRNQIQQAANDAFASLKTLEANQKNLEALEEAFGYASDRFAAQAINAFQYNDAAGRLFAARAETLIARYDYVFKTLVLEFYLGRKFSF